MSDSARYDITIRFSYDQPPEDSLLATTGLSPVHGIAQRIRDAVDQDVTLLELNPGRAPILECGFTTDGDRVALDADDPGNPTLSLNAGGLKTRYGELYGVLCRISDIPAGERIPVVLLQRMGHLSSKVLGDLEVMFGSIPVPEPA